MSLRSKLLLWMALLLALGLALSGFLVVRSTKANLVDQVDDSLQGVRGSLIGPPFGGPPPEIEADPSGRQIAVVIYDGNGEVVAAEPSGFASAPDPLPEVPASIIENPAPGKVVTVPAVDGSLSYRAVVEPDRDGTVRVVAASLEAVDRAVAALIRNIAVIGGVVLVALLVVGWWLLRRGLRPLEAMAATAGQIASGDMSQRVPDQHDRSEVGRLGEALNTMLDRIQQAFDEQRAALTAKERSEAQLRQFVADASHELRTPLTTLRGYVDLYRAGALEEEDELNRAMRRIGSESARMGSLIEDLLLLARLDEGLPLRSEPVNLTRLVDDAVDDERALEHGRPLLATVERDVRVIGDEDRLRQVVGNLMANVRTHTSPATPCDVTLDASDHACRLSVADHGPGIEPLHAGHVFDRFYRADPGRSRDRGGSGLGLPIVKAIVEAHGGTIDYSPTPGGGATFAVSLPLAPAA